LSYFYLQNFSVLHWLYVKPVLLSTGKKPGNNPGNKIGVRFITKSPAQARVRVTLAGGMYFLNVVLGNNAVLKKTVIKK
jgi:hypothetical protein